jgi:hypothetical protein
VILKPTTLLKLHKVLVDRKYRLIISSSANRRKPGPKGRSTEPAAAIVDGAHRIPTFRCVRDAQQIGHAPSAFRLTRTAYAACSPSITMRLRRKLSLCRANASRWPRRSRKPVASWTCMLGRILAS